MKCNIVNHSINSDKRAQTYNVVISPIEVKNLKKVISKKLKALKRNNSKELINSILMIDFVKTY